MKSGSLSAVAAVWLVAVSAQAAIRIAAVSGEPYPAAVGADGQAHTIYTAKMMLDGDLGTFACLLDDTRTGNDPHSRPPNGSLPVTGIVVFDLGAVHKVCGLELVSRLAGTCYLPRVVDVLAVEAESVTAEMLTGAESDSRLPWITNVQDRELLHEVSDQRERTIANRAAARIRLAAQPPCVLARHQVPASAVSGKGHVMLWDTIQTRFLGLRVRSSYTPVDGRHYNYQVAELRALVLDEDGQRLVLTHQGQQRLETLPALAAAVSRAKAQRHGEDELTSAERRYREQGLNATQPYPEARLHKDWIY